MKTGVRGTEIKETHTDGLRGAGRAHREAPCSESGVWGGALCSSPPSPPGMHRKPSLSARPGASVPQGENVTLQCRSEVQSDTFHLSKEGSLAAPQHLRLQDPAPPVQANFTLRAVTSAHSGTYRCYSSHSTAPHLLSIPSDPLELQVSGEGPALVLCVLRVRPGPCSQGSSGLSGSGGSQKVGINSEGAGKSQRPPFLARPCPHPGRPDPLLVMEQSYTGLRVNQQDSRPEPSVPTLLWSPVFMAPRPESSTREGLTEPVAPKGASGQALAQLVSRGTVGLLGMRHG